jgi:hypothetical protein
MRIQSSHTIDERGLDAYFTCVEAVEALILLEGSRLPQRIWEPAAGDGAIVKALRASGRTVHASDIADYGLPGCHIMDYLSAPKMPAAWVYGVVTNPPYRRAQAFAGRALAEVPYVALLLRTNFLMDAERRGRWLDRNEPTRTYYLLPRLPMMHREGYQGKKSSSNTHPSPGSSGRRVHRVSSPRRVYWRELLGIQKPKRSGAPGNQHTGPLVAREGSKTFRTSASAMTSRRNGNNSPRSTRQSSILMLALALLGAAPAAAAEPD